MDINNLRLKYISVIYLLMKIRNNLSDIDQELVDMAIHDAKSLGLLKDVEQMKSGEWFR